MYGPHESVVILGERRRIERLALGTINAALRAPVRASELVQWLGATDSAGDAGDARADLALTTFFLETPLEVQVEFLRLHEIPESRAIAIANELGLPRGFPLAKRHEW